MSTWDAIAVGLCCLGSNAMVGGYVHGWQRGNNWCYTLAESRAEMFTGAEHRTFANATGFLWLTAAIACALDAAILHQAAEWLFPSLEWLSTGLAIAFGAAAGLSLLAALVAWAFMPTWLVPHPWRGNPGVVPSSIEY